MSFVGVSRVVINKLSTTLDENKKCGNAPAGPVTKTELNEGNCDLAT